MLKFTLKKKEGMIIKNLYCAYYTNSDAITQYMTNMIQLEDNDKVLEPSAGEGIFIESLLRQNKLIYVDALDMNSDAITILKNKFASLQENISIRETDTLFDSELDLYNMFGGHYDKIIGNPPYGAWQDYDKRNLLKKKYPGYYVKETYTLFLLRCLSVLKNGGKLSFIIPDTFMFLNMHENLRKTLLQNAIINQILIFPSKFFPGVNFGYSNLSIITLTKTDNTQEALSNSVNIIKGFKEVDELPGISLGIIPPHLKSINVCQQDIFNNKNSRFLIDCSDSSIDLNRIPSTLGDVANIVTGFYSGDNIRFIRAKDKNIKGAKKYAIVEAKDVSEHADNTGILDPEKSYVPYIKTASKRRYLREEDEWFLRWDAETIDYYQTNKKSRFQNSQFYFKKGICIPMVKSRTIRASLMENRVFDQAIVGIFPHNDNMLMYILAFMNSDIACKMIHIINPTANNSSNYVKQIPFIMPQRTELEYITTLVEKLLSALRANDSETSTNLHNQLNKYFDSLYSPKLNS